MLSSRFYSALLTAAVIACPVAAIAGPCSDDIAQLSRQLGGMPGLGAPVSGVAGEPVSGTHTAQAGSTGASDKAQPGGASRTGGGSAGTVGGVSGAAGGAKDAVASGQVATSDQDVRSQSVGKPTAAQSASSGQPAPSTVDDDRVSQAKMSLQTAIDLNSKGDSSCSAAVTKTRGYLQKG